MLEEKENDHDRKEYIILERNYSSYLQYYNFKAFVSRSNLCELLKLCTAFNLSIGTVLIAVRKKKFTLKISCIAKGDHNTYTYLYQIASIL